MNPVYRYKFRPRPSGLISQSRLPRLFVKEEQVPEALRRQPLEGVDQPIQIYLTCYHILREVGDPRAADVLARAHDQMTANTARIFDPVIRAAF